MAKEIIERNSKQEKELSPLTKVAIELHNASKTAEEEQKNIPEGEDADGE